MIDVDDEPESWTIRELKDRFRSNTLKRDSTFESFNNNNYDFDCKNSADLVPNKLVVNFNFSYPGFCLMRSVNY